MSIWRSKILKAFILPRGLNILGFQIYSWKVKTTLSCLKNYFTRYTTAGSFLYFRSLKIRMERRKWMEKNIVEFDKFQISKYLKLPEKGGNQNDQDETNNSVKGIKKQCWWEVGKLVNRYNEIKNIERSRDKTRAR